MMQLLASPPAIIVQAERFELCCCPECRMLDRRFPGQGQQLALFRLGAIERGLFEMVDRKRGLPR